MTTLFVQFISFLFFIAISIFFYFNIKIVLDKIDAIKKLYFMETTSFIWQIKYFSIMEKKIYSLNVSAALLFGIGGMHLKIGVFGIIFGALAGWYFPSFILSRVRKKYLTKMEDQLYGSLILIGNAIRAGETLPQAIENIMNVVGYPIAQEFEIITQQLRVGMSMEDTLLDMTKRIPLDDLNLAVQAMIISIKTGADMPTALRKIADTIKQRDLFRKKINTLTTQGRAEGIVVGILPFVLGFFLYLGDHTYIEVLFKTFLGNCVIATMITLEVFAYFSIKRICTIKF